MGKDETGNLLNRAHRRRFLLSGLLKCGCCGADYAVLAQNRYGCSSRRSKATCENARTIERDHIEARVLGAMQDRLLTPELVDRFITTFLTELERLQRESGAKEGRINDQLNATNRKQEGVLRAIENGACNDSLKIRLNQLEAQKTDLQMQLKAAANPDPGVRLHPNAAALYAAKVADLKSALNVPENRAEAIDHLRLLINGIVLTPDENAPDRLAVELHGDLAMILNLAAPSGQPRGKVAALSAAKNPQSRLVPEGLPSMVAGARFERAAFRL